MKVACLWSGGKDSCYAYWKAIEQGHDVRYLVNFTSSESGRSSFHWVRRELICMQSEALEIPMLQRETTKENYEQVYREVMQELRRREIEGLVTGDIDLADGKAWVESNCRDSGLKALLPLWGLDPNQILKEFVDEGFEAIVILLKADLLDEKWLGRKIDKKFINSMHESRQNPNFHICGENGEYHTFVVDGPAFKKRISVTNVNDVFKDGYWFLDIEQAKPVPKVV